jgi:hypothetical protein
MTGKKLPSMDDVGHALDDTIEALDNLVIPHADADCPICAQVRAAILTARGHAIINGETGEVQHRQGASWRQVALQWAMAIDWARELHDFAAGVIAAHLGSDPESC